MISIKRKLLPIALIGILLIGIGCIGPFAEDEVDDDEENGVPENETDKEIYGEAGEVVKAYHEAFDRGEFEEASKYLIVEEEGEEFKEYVKEIDYTEDEEFLELFKEYLDIEAEIINEEIHNGEATVEVRSKVVPSEKMIEEGEGEDIVEELKENQKEVKYELTKEEEWKIKIQEPEDEEEEEELLERPIKKIIFWIGGLTPKPPGSGTAQTAFTVAECNLEDDGDATTRIVNTGGIKIDERTVDVYSRGQYAGEIQFKDGLEPGEEAYVPLEGEFEPGVQYTVVDGDFPEITFHCN